MLITKYGFTRPTMQELITSVTGDINSRLESIQGNLTRKTLSVLKIFVPIIASVWAGGLYMLYLYLDSGMSNFFIPYSKTEYLDLWGETFNLPRKAASFAEGSIVAYGSVGEIIPKDTLWQNESTKFQYKVLEDGTISADDGETEGEVTLRVIATTSGADGNMGIGEVLFSVNPLEGIQSEAVVSEDEPISGALDTEDDDDYRSRLLYRVQNAPSGGAPHDFVRWATNVTEVQHAWVVRCCPRPGFATVYYYNREGDELYNPVPHGGGAYMVPYEGLGSDSNGNYLIVSYRDFIPALGRVPTRGWFGGGAIIENTYDGAPGLEVKIRDEGIIPVPGFIKIPFEGDLDLDKVESVNILCKYTKKVYDSIYTQDIDSGVYNQTPIYGTTFVKLPQIVEIEVVVDLTPDTDDFRSKVSLEIMEMFNYKCSVRELAKQPDQVTTEISSWNIHDAIMNTEGHLNHTLVGIIRDGQNLLLDDELKGSIILAYNEIAVLKETSRSEVA